MSTNDTAQLARDLASPDSTTRIHAVRAAMAQQGARLREVQDAADHNGHLPPAAATTEETDR